MYIPGVFQPYPQHFMSAEAQERSHVAGFHVKPWDDSQGAWQIWTPGNIIN
jgi:hypothetical protein